MWFLVHCYEDQGRIDAALELCAQLQELLRGFGRETLAQQHKFWRYVEEKMQELKRLETEREMSGRAVDPALTVPVASSCDVPPKKVIADCTY